MDEQQEIIQEFLVESNESLSQLDQDFVELEQRPDDADLLSSIFRTIHTIKGACGFLGFTVLESITHRAENLLSQLRDGERRLTPDLTTLLLETFDTVRDVLGRIEATGEEGDEAYAGLCARLQAVCDDKAAAENPKINVEDYNLGALPEQETVESEAPEETAPASEDDEMKPRGGVEPDAAVEDHHAHRSSIADSNIRVSVHLLDSLMNLVGELVLARNQILQHAEAASATDDTGFTGASQRLNLITTELQAAVMKTRMQPIRVVWNKLPRVVRDLGSSFGKRVELEMEGAETELDKTIIEAIKDPLTHIVRNSCDHGIETPEERVAAGKQPQGVLSLRAFHEGGQVNIEISDDGRGIDPQKLKDKAVAKGTLTPEHAARMSDREALDLIFAAGFSTAEKVTNVSGRGVGMDVVRTNIERIGGSIELQSTPGRGATIRIKIPLTLAIIPALVVSCSGERFAIPQVNLVELVRIEPGHAQGIETIHGAPVYRLRGKLLPLVYLNEVVGLESDAAGDQSVNIIVVQADERTFGLVVDGVQDTAEIVVKPLGKLLKNMSVYAGATIMGDGNVALILDVMGLAKSGRVIGETRSHGAGAAEAVAGAEERQTLLLFRAGDSDRLAVPLALVDRLEEFPAERVETSGGRPVVQYRERILPLLELAEKLGGERRALDAQHPAQVLVFSEGEHRIGIVVDEILDIVEENVTARGGANREGIAGSAVVGDRITDLIDLRRLIEGADPNWFGSGTTGAREILLVDEETFSRGLLRQRLEGAGYHVFEAGDSEEALRLLSTNRIQAILARMASGADRYPLLDRLSARPDLADIPVIGLADSYEEAGRIADRGVSVADCRLRLDEAAVLESIEKLAGTLSEKPVEQAV